MVGVVEPDGDEVAHAADAGAEPRPAGDGFQPLEIGLFDLGEAAPRQHGAVDVRHHARQVADFTVGADNAGLFAAGRAIADELHVKFLPGIFVF